MTIEERLAALERRLAEMEKRELEWLRLEAGIAERPSLEALHAATVAKVKLARERGGLSA